MTCLVTLFDRKLQVFKNSPKLTIFDIFNELSTTQNVNLACFAGNIEWDFFCDFHSNIKALCEAYRIFINTGPSAPLGPTDQQDEDDVYTLHTALCTKSTNHQRSIQYRTFFSSTLLFVSFFFHPLSTPLRLWAFNGFL